MSDIVYGYPQLLGLASGTPGAPEGGLQPLGYNLLDIELAEMLREGFVSASDRRFRVGPERTPSYNAGGLQDWLDYCLEENLSGLLPVGVIRYDAPISFSYGLRTFLGQGRPGIFGAGVGQSYLEYTGPNDTTALTVSGGEWSAASTPTSRMKLQGFTVNCVDPSVRRTCIDVSNCIDMRWDDIGVMQGYYAVKARDIVHWTLVNFTQSFNNYGFEGERSTHIYSGGDGYGSPVNELVLIKPKCIGNRQWGWKFWDSTNIVVEGGSTEATGRPSIFYSSDAERWGWRVIAMGYNGGAALVMRGHHWETGAGNADLWIDHDYPRPNPNPPPATLAVDLQATYDISGCDFVRNAFDFENSGIAFVDNNIRFTTPGTAKASLNVKADFTGVNGYTPSSSRRYIDFSQAFGSNHDFNDIGSTYQSSVELPLYFQSGARKDSLYFATADIGATGTIAASKNMFSITRTGVGVFTVLFSSFTATANYGVLGDPANTIRLHTVTARTTAGFTLNLFDLAGAPADPSPSFWFGVTYG